MAAFHQGCKNENFIKWWARKTSLGGSNVISVRQMFDRANKDANSELAVYSQIKKRPSYQPRRDNTDPPRNRPPKHKNKEVNVAEQSTLLYHPLYLQPN
uniref:Uncharacterized protein n=1 Tax=Oryza punctata TaxID=4537 RepID=A0A0E0LC80_ORYPU